MNTNDCINDILWAGTFAGDLSHDFSTMTSTGATDIFIGSLDLLLKDQWFTHEGSDFRFSEAARSLELKGSELFVYGERQNGGGTITSDFYNSTGALLGSGVFSSFPPTSINPIQGNIFTAGFSSSGSFLDGIRTIGVGSGVSRGEDLTLVDTSFVNVGSLNMILGDQLQFLDQSSTIQNVLFQSSNISDAFLARTFGFQLGSFKWSGEQSESYEPHNGYIIYPNPTEGLINIQFDELRSGEIVLKDALGKELKKTVLHKSELVTVEIVGTPGVYFLEIRLENSFFIEKIIKK